MSDICRIEEDVIGKVVLDGFFSAVQVSDNEVQS